MPFLLIDGCHPISGAVDADAVDGWVSGGLFRHGHDDWRCVATTVNRLPATL